MVSWDWKCEEKMDRVEGIIGGKTERTGLHGVHLRPEFDGRDRGIGILRDALMLGWCERRFATATALAQRVRMW